MAALTPTPNILVGKCVAVYVGGVWLYSKGGSVSRKADLIKVTNARSKGYTQLRPGIKAASGSVDLVFNCQDPLQMLNPGQEVDLVIDTTGTDANPTAVVGMIHTLKAVLGEITDSWQVDGDFGISINWESSGEWQTVVG
jgi:hypothetical protein